LLLNPNAINSRAGSLNVFPLPWDRLAAFARAGLGVDGRRGRKNWHGTRCNRLDRIAL